MLWTFLQSFSFIPHIVSELILEYVSLILVAMTTNQIERIGQKSICLVEDHSTNISKNICNETAINANFQFSHYKSMGI